MNRKALASIIAIFICCTGLGLAQSATVVDKTVDSIMQKVVQRDYEKAYSYVLFLAKIKGDEPLSDAAVTACEEAVDAYTGDLSSRREWKRLVEVGTELAGVPLSAQKKAEPRIAEAKSRLVSESQPETNPLPAKPLESPKPAKEKSKHQEEPTQKDVSQIAIPPIVIQDERTARGEGVSHWCVAFFIALAVCILLVCVAILIVVLQAIRPLNNTHRVASVQEDPELTAFVRTCEEIGKRVDLHTGRKNNSRNVARIVRDLSLSAGHTEAEATLHYAIALARDAGFLFVESSLFAAGSLDAEAIKALHEHTTNALSLATFAGERFRDQLSQGIAAHHENHDGSGYPFGTKGAKIPFVARAIRLAESYDAMVSPRPYHAIRDSRSAVAELVDNPLVYDKRLACALEDLL
jgi:HD-GYP domain-containing protein (c-di-GMP phosphodiesterase class II)